MFIKTVLSKSCKLADIQMLAMIGFVVCALMKLADSKGMSVLFREHLLRSAVFNPA